MPRAQHFVLAMLVWTAILVIGGAIWGAIH